MNTNKPKVSVIITTHKRPRCLKEAVASVLSQDFQNFELIVVNDAPGDREAERVVSSFNDPHIHYIENAVNLGSTKSLNVGLRAAQGDYAAILDDDDAWISDNKLSLQVAFFDEHPDYVLVGTNVVVVRDADGEEITRSHFEGNDKELRARMFRGNPFAHSSVVFHRRVALSVGGYDESLSRGKDYDLWLKLGTTGKFAVLSEYLVKYREATPFSRDIIAMKRFDSSAKLAVMRRHRKNYPFFWLPYCNELFRRTVFEMLYWLTYPLRAF